jgi:hypothetical protein
MPKPTHGDMHISAALTNVSVAYQQSRTNYVAERFAPIIPVMKEGDQFFTYSICPRTITFVSGMPSTRM